jgi:vacuolar-type H+-ATPase subunit E/Vma4
MVAAIREDADAEVQRIEETTAKELAAIRDEGSGVSVAIPDREERLTMERRANDERLAKQEWEGRRAAIERREEWMQRVVAKAREQWPCGNAARLDALVREARSRMPRGACEIGVCARDRDLVDVADANVVTAPIAGGCVVTSGDVSFDNSFEARSRRLEPEWRSALSGMYKP